MLSTNWHNEVFEDLGWLAEYVFDGELPQKTNPPAKHGPGSYCRYCGTTTGQHGFSFDSNGKY